MNQPARVRRGAGRGEKGIFDGRPSGRTQTDLDLGEQTPHLLGLKRKRWLVDG